MYFDNWSEKSFNENSDGYCICQHCEEQVPIKDPSKTDICPHCGKPIITPPESYNIYLFNGTRDIKFDTAGSLVGPILILGIFVAIGIWQFVLGSVFAGIVCLLPVAIIGFIIVGSKIGRTKTSNTITYPGTIIGVSYAYGSLAQVQGPPEELRRRMSAEKQRETARDMAMYHSKTLFVRYTVLFNREGTNAISYVYAMVANSDFRINEEIFVNIKNDKQIWLSRD